MPRREPDLEAEIYALPTENGGRKFPMVSGNRPIHDFGLPNELNGAVHEYTENGKINPGETGPALLWLLAPDRLHKLLFEGMEFTVQDGRQIVGKGRILKVLKQELKRPEGTS